MASQTAEIHLRDDGLAAFLQLSVLGLLPNHSSAIDRRRLIGGFYCYAVRSGSLYAFLGIVAKLRSRSLPQPEHRES